MTVPKQGDFVGSNLANAGEFTTQAGVEMSFWTDVKIEELKTHWKAGLTASQIARRFDGEVTRNAVIGKVHRLGMGRRGLTQTGKRRQRLNARKAALTGFSRNEKVAKKVAAAGGRAAWVKQQYERLAREASLTGSLPSVPLPSKPEIEIPPGERKQLVDLEAADCHWPIGDPKQPGFHFCGRKKVDGLPYCEPHALRAYRPPTPKTGPKPASSYKPRVLADV